MVVVVVIMVLIVTVIVVGAVLLLRQVQIADKLSRRASLRMSFDQKSWSASCRVWDKKCICQRHHRVIVIVFEKTGVL